MDPSNALPGFSFTSDASKATSVCRNLRNYLFQQLSLMNRIAEIIFFLTISLHVQVPC